MDAKRRQTRTIAGLGGISDAGLARVMARLRDEPALMHDCSSRYVITRAVDELFDSFGETVQLPLRDGGHFQWDYAQPQKIFNYFVVHSPTFAELVASLHRRNPSLPMRAYNLVLYLDEITPGNVIRPDNKLKAWGIYFSIREFGPGMLCRQEALLPTAVLRSTAAKALTSGVSEAMCVWLRRAFDGADGLSTAGMPLNLPLVGPCLVFVK